MIHRPKSPLVTFLIPSRKRLAPLVNSILSIEATCSSLCSFEVIVIFDEDDIATIQEFDEINFQCSIVKIISKRYGYYGLHHYLNNAYEKTSGKWFWLWNDDMTMVANNWDVVIESYKDRFVVLNPANENSHWSRYVKDASISPIVPRKWFQLLDRFSAYSQYDTYINSIAYPLNIVIYEDRLINNHQQIKDEVSIGVSYEYSKFPHYESTSDLEKIKKFIGRRQLFIYWLERLPYRTMKYFRRRIKHFKRMLNLDYIKQKLKKIFGVINLD